MTAEAYPLQWPPGVPRTKYRNRANFSSYGHPMSMTSALDRLEHELDLMRASWVVVSTNVALRLDGRPYANQRIPDDPGAAVYFTLHGEQRCIPCDCWDRVEDNITAVAKAIGAMRGIERWVNDTNVRAAFQGFAALPETLELDWRQVLQLQDVEPGRLTREVVKRAYSTLAQRYHPDRGGSHEQMAELNRARDRAMEAVQ